MKDAVSLPLSIRTAAEKPSPSRMAKKNPVWRKVWYYRYIYLMLFPGMLFFIIFKYVPMYGIQLAFKNFYANRGIMGSPWIGLANFRALWGERMFLTAFFNTLIISAMKIGFGFPVPIILAILINEIKNPKYKKTLQTIFTFPHFLSWVILAGIAMNLFASAGAANNLLTRMGVERQEFLTNKATFRYFLVFSEIWKEAGWSTILYLAAIAGIDTAIYEAATVDGANRTRKMLHITLPGIANMTIVLFILNLGGIMEAGFMQVFNVYNAAVYAVADIIDTYVYRVSFQQAPDFGFSTAVGLFKGVANVILLLTANRTAKLFGHDGIL
jgi:putative aldouronate transport system permease protein